MSVLQVLNQPWAVIPSTLDQLQAVYERHASGVALDAEAIKAAIGADPRRNQQGDSPYEVDRGVAIVPVQGVLAKKMNLFTAISGGMSSEMLADAIAQADADPSVRSILLDIDTPGGQVDGTQQLGDAIAATNKPIIAFVDGQCCSAGLWIASQADSIYAASDTSMVGSMGVIMKHKDYSEANKQEGVAVTHITTGKYKAAGNPDAPLSDSAKEKFQAEVDYLYTLFLNAVADGRGMDAAVLHDIAGEAEIFFAQQAVDNGLIDGIISKENLVSRLSSGDYSPVSKTNASTSAITEEPTMFKSYATEAEFNAEISAAEARGKASATVTQAQIDSAKAEALTAGAKAERERITAIDALALADVHKAVVAKCKADGTSPEATGLAILAAEGATRTQHANDRKEEIPKPADASHPDPAKEAAERSAAATAAQFEASITPKAIQAQITKAQSEGRTIGPADAVAELREAATAK